MIDIYRRNTHARLLFDGIARNYEAPAEVFSFFQYGIWRRFLVAQLQLPPRGLVLDVCTGTGLVARDIAKRTGCQVVGVDLSQAMLVQAERTLHAEGLAPPVALVEARAESLPFPDASFDAVVFTFLVRYVEDVEETLRELARVLRPGGQLLSLEFFVPQNRLLFQVWRFYAHVVLPLATRLLPPHWRRVAAFLGPSISAFYRKHSLDDLREMWRRVGLGDVQTRTLTFGGALVMSGQKPAHLPDRQAHGQH